MNLYQKFVSSGMSVVCSSVVQKVLNKIFGIEPKLFKIGFVREADGR